MFIRILFLCLWIICGHPRGTYHSAAAPVLYSETSPVSHPPRITAPWMTPEELAALHLNAYCQVIIDVNIFRPLQKHERVKINPYQLIGTLEKEKETLAYLLDTFTKKVHPVTSGEKLDKFTVENVTRRSVTLRDKNDVITKLELGTMFLK